MTKPLHLYGPLPRADQVLDYYKMAEKIKEIQEKVGRFIEPDDRICLIFDKISYDKLRELPEYAQSYADDES